MSKFDAITIVINETSTGIENDLRALRNTVNLASDKVIILADAVSAAFGTKIKISDADVLLFGTQKCLALPPGITIIVTNEKALDRANRVKNKGYYFDFLKMKEFNENNLTIATPNISLLYALKKRLCLIKEEGINNFINEHEKKADLVRRWAVDNGFGLLVKGRYSKTVTVIENNRGINIENIIKKLEERDYCIANGYGHLKNKTFRIGHMGDITVNDTINMLQELEGIINASANS